MRYFGGKAVVGKRLSAEIINYIIKKNTKKKIDFDNTVYIELFCGACGILRYMAPYFKKCYANDIHKDLIMLLKSVKNGTFKNPKITREKWLEYKYSKKSSANRAFAGFANSYGGVWFNGYINDNGDNNDMEYSSLVRLSPKLQNTLFSNKNYINFLKEFEFDKNKNYVIYMDPPYKNTSCQPWETFDSNEFWEITRKLGKLPNITVIVSEVSAPKDFKCFFKLERRNGMHNITSDKLIIKEKLYTI